MADATLNNAPVIELEMSLPLNGAWSANVQVASDKAPAQGARASLELAGQAFECLVKRSGVFTERAQVRLVGGLTDWEAPLPAKHYQATDVATVLSDMGVTTDETVSGFLAFWTRQSGTVGAAMQQLADHLGLNWRINPDGTVRLRSEAPFAVDPDAVELERDKARGIVILAPERASVLPGTQVGDDVVESVLYSVGEKFRCRYTTSGRRSFWDAIERLMRWVTRDSIYLGTYLCEVVRQAPDGTLDLMPFDQRIRSNGLQAVPIRHGIAGVSSVEVPAGELVMLAFDQGSSSKPYAALFNTGKVTRLVLDIGSLEVGGTVAVALATLVKSELDRIASVFDGHTHIITGTAGPNPVTATNAPPAAPMSPIAEVASEKLKTE